MIHANKRERLYHHSSEWIGMVNNHQNANQNQSVSKKLLGLVGFKRHTQHTPQNTKPRHKKPAPEYPTAGVGVGVLFRVSFVVQSLAVLYTTHNPEDDVSSGGNAVFQI